MLIRYFEIILHVDILSIQYLHGLKNSLVCHELSLSASVCSLELHGEHHVMYCIQKTKVNSYCLLVYLHVYISYTDQYGIYILQCSCKCNIIMYVS